MMKSNLLDEILEECRATRNSAILKCENIKDALNNNDKYYALEKQKNALIFEKGKALFEQKSTKQIDERLASILASQDQVISDLGYDKSDLVPHFSCEKCNDTGFLDNKLCSCVRQKYNNALMRQSNIDFNNVPYLSDYDYSIFSNEIKEYMKLVKESLMKFVENFEIGKIKNIVLTAPTGVGKTFIAQSLAKEIIKKGHTALFCSAFEMNNIFLESHTSMLVDKIQRLNQLISPDLLVIDDFGSEPILKNVTLEYLLLLINERNLQNKNTIFTTNLLPNNILDKYNERIFSRLFDKSNSLLINLRGEDLRLKNR